MAVLPLPPIKSSSAVLSGMKAHHIEGGGKGEGAGKPPAERKIKRVAGGEPISAIYKAGHEQIKNIRKLLLVNRM